MNRTLFLFIFFISNFAFGAEDSDIVRLKKIAIEISHHGKAYSDLKELTDKGHRLCGSAGEANAVQWAKEKLKAYGADSTWLQPVMVPHWIRGKNESGRVTDSGLLEKFQVTALGNSPGTGSSGVEAEVVEVKSLDEVKKRGSAVKDKIVFYNRPMDPTLSDTFKAYGGAVDQRSQGAMTAGKLGAKAVLVRSMTTLSDDDHPHTGGVSENENPKIPAAAISTHGANQLSKLLLTHPHLKFRLELSSESLPMIESHNVIGELKGSEHPEEYILVGGHIDSWDLATGAMDDGSGAVQAIEVLRTFHSLGIKPKRSVRVVLFACEEFGGFGGIEYAKQSKLKSEKHLIALESDNGGFAPRGFTFQTPDDSDSSFFRGWKKYLEPFHVSHIEKGESETDVEPLVPNGTVAVGLRVDPKLYFNYHHSSLDRFDIIDKKDLLDGAAAMAAFVYLATEKGLEVK